MEIKIGSYYDKENKKYKPVTWSIEDLNHLVQVSDENEDQILQMGIDDLAALSSALKTWEERQRAYELLKKLIDC